MLNGKILPWILKVNNEGVSEIGHHIYGHKIHFIRYNSYVSSLIPSHQLHSTMPTPPDRSTQVPSAHDLRHADGAATTTTAPATSKQQTSPPGSDETQEEIRHWKEVALLVEGWGCEIRSGNHSFVEEWKKQITAEETVFHDRAKDRAGSPALVSTMILFDVSG